MATNKRKPVAAPKAEPVKPAMPVMPAKTLRQAITACSDDLGRVMSRTGKHPGDFEALQAELQRIIKLNHPLLNEAV